MECTLLVSFYSHTQKFASKLLPKKIKTIYNINRSSTYLQIAGMSTFKHGRSNDEAGNNQGVYYESNWYTSTVFLNDIVNF